MLSDVLLIDDDVALATLLSFSLSHEFSVQALHSSDAVYALHEQLGGDCPRVVLLDLGLPPMPYTPRVGLSLLSQLIAWSSSTKVIVLTGQDQDDVAFQALSLGAFDFIAKPATPEVLISAIKRAYLFLKQQDLATDQGVHTIAFSVAEDAGLKQVRNEAEKRLFMQVWTQSGENVHATARRLNIKRENVYYLLDKFGICRECT